MTDAVAFPSYWGPKGGDPVLARNALEIEEGWVQHYGRYNVQTGQWEARDPADMPPAEPSRLENFRAAAGVEKGTTDADHNGEMGGSTSAVADLKELRAAYKKKMGKAVFPGWSADEIKRRMA